MPSHGSGFISHPSPISALPILSDKTLLVCSPHSKKHCNISQGAAQKCRRAKKLFSISYREMSY